MWTPGPCGRGRGRARLCRQAGGARGGCSKLSQPSPRLWNSAAAAPAASAGGRAAARFAGGAARAILRRGGSGSVGH
eukprot:9485736-Pyramimonas_sp.AAC.1